MVIEFKVARGWKAIAEMVGASVSTVKDRWKNGGLPIKFDKKTPILTSYDYVKWNDCLPNDYQN